VKRVEEARTGAEARRPRLQSGACKPGKIDAGNEQFKRELDEVEKEAVSSQLRRSLAAENVASSGGCKAW
jgi:hypothetical protein